MQGFIIGRPVMELSRRDTAGFSETRGQLDKIEAAPRAPVSICPAMSTPCSLPESPACGCRKAACSFTKEWWSFGTRTPSAFFICGVNRRKKGEAMRELQR